MGTAGGFFGAFLATQETVTRIFVTKFYRQYRLMRMASKAEQVIKQLFNAYLADPRLLPTTTQERLESEDSGAGGV